MTKLISDASAADYEELQAEIGTIDGCSCAQDAAQKFADVVYERFSASLVLLQVAWTSTAACSTSETQGLTWTCRGVLSCQSRI